MTSKVRIGIIGTSGWTDFMYLSSLKEFPQAEMVAICGRNTERAKELADKYQIPNTFTDYREMIQSGTLDAVIIASPDDLHHEMVKESAKAGLHILCDKPLAVTAQQAKEMYEAVQSAGVKHKVLFTYRWMPLFRHVHDLVEQGVVGRVYHCEFRYEMGYARSSDYHWRLDKKRANGALADLGSHIIDLAHWLVGDITRVSAHLSTFVERKALDGSKLDSANDSSFVLAEFANGAHGIIHATLVAHLADRFMQQQIKLYGEAGSLEVNMTYNGSEAGGSVFVARNEDEKFQLVPIPENYWGGVDHLNPFGVFSAQPVGCREFILNILEDRQSAPDFEDGYKVQQVIEAALMSHNSGKWIDLEETIK